MTDLPVAEILSTENGVWALVAFVLVRELIHTRRHAKGPAWITNGAMDSLLDRFTLRLQRTLAESQAPFASIPARNEELLRRHGEEQKRNGAKLDVISAGLSAIPDLSAQTAEVARQMAICGEHLESQSVVMKAVVRELNVSRLCPYRPEDAQAIAREVERKRRADRHTRATDLGIDPEDIK